MDNQSTNGQKENWPLPSIWRVVLQREGFIAARPEVGDVHAALEVLRTNLLEWDREVFAVALLSLEYRLIGISTVAIGTLTAVAASTREILKVALLSNASYLVLAHNHPVGPARASRADVELTREIMAICEYMGITVLDHLIIGESEVYSALTGDRWEI